MRVVPELWTAATPPRDKPKYRRRDPEASLLHRIVRENLESFLALAKEEGRPVPAFVEEEFREYLKCGVLAHVALRGAVSLFGPTDPDAFGLLARVGATYELSDGVSGSVGHVHYTPGDDLGPLSGFGDHDQLPVDEYDTPIHAGYVSAFGFTEAEVEDLADLAGARDHLDELRDSYDGCLFGGQVVFSPWSVLSYLASSDRALRNWWVSTSSNDLLRDLLVRGGSDCAAVSPDSIGSGSCYCAARRPDLTGAALRDPPGGQPVSEATRVTSQRLMLTPSRSAHAAISSCSDGGSRSVSRPECSRGRLGMGSPCATASSSQSLTASSAFLNASSGVSPCVRHPCSAGACAR